MRYLFCTTFLLLILASIFTFLTKPQEQSNVPAIYWATNSNPVRQQQVEGFEKWLIKNGHTTSDGKPVCKILLDTSDSQTEKKIIHGVCGVADTLLDMSGSGTFQLLHSIGLLTDITKAGKKFGFSYSKTWPAMRWQIVLNGRQFAFPANVAAPMLWVNKQTFKNFNQPLPPKRWSFKKFEKRGKAFVKAANKGLEWQHYFFANGLNRKTLYRSVGLSLFNETLTKCDLDDPRYINILKLLYKWTYIDHILPSQSDKYSFSTKSGYGGSNAQLFNHGYYAMMYSGRYMLAQFRNFNRYRKKKGKPLLQLTVVESPNGGFPNSVTAARSVGIYKGATKKQKEYAKLFLTYLASKQYNMMIVQDADGIPPVPKYTNTKAYRHPPKYPSEWGTPHTAFSSAERHIAIGTSISPFILNYTSMLIEWQVYGRFMNNLITAKQAAAIVQKRINEKITQRVQSDPNLQKLYKKRIALQKKIDKYRKQGKKIPISWIKNTFYKKYYKGKGWAG